MKFEAEILSTRSLRSAPSPSPLKKTAPGTRSSKFGAENANPNLLRPADPSVPPPAAKPNLQEPGLKGEAGFGSEAPASDPCVKVVARIRPAGVYERNGDVVVRRVSSNSLSVEDKMYAFDSVFDSTSNQEDVFQVVGVPVVKDSLAGFNTSILSYGQTGSGKTYTMWGPQSAMVEGFSSSVYQGIVPRAFNMLFLEIQKEKESSDSILANYQCRCSFLELCRKFFALCWGILIRAFGFLLQTLMGLWLILFFFFDSQVYNEHITDLLDPTHRNLEIQDDVKNGFSAENLTEEYVNCANDITQILIKGLLNRKFGSTSLNTKSSRSHIIFTCVVESWSKAICSQSISSSKSSRMSFIDLAGSEKNKLDDVGRDSIEDARNVNRSLSRLGNLVNFLAGASHSENSENASYNRSCLTNLLRETLGGNTKLTVIYAISPTGRYKGETLSTLRFGEKARKMLNNAVVNEINEDNVNDLSDQIRQLKEELISVKSSGQCSNSNSTRNFQGHRARESLNQLRVSLYRSLILPRLEHNDLEEEVNVDEVDVQELCVQFASLHDGNGETSDNGIPQAISAEGDSDMAENMSNKIDEVNSYSEGYPEALVLEEPVQCESPKVLGNSKKSTTIELARSSFQKGAIDRSVLSVKASDLIRSSLSSRSMLAGPTESLAASLRRGLQKIDSPQRKPPSDNVSDEQCHSLGKVEAGVQALSLCNVSDEQCHSLGKVEAGVQALSLCNVSDSINNVEESLNMWIVPGKNKKELLNKVEQPDYPEAPKKLRELEALCEAQATQIELLNNRADIESREKKELLEEIEKLKIKLQLQKNALEDVTKIQATTISSMLENKSENELDKERERWTEAESRWICLTEELRLDLESTRRLSDKIQHELLAEKQCSIEHLEDALQRSLLGHGYIVEHYAELQEKYESLHWNHRKIMEGIAEMKRAAAKVGKSGGKAVFMESLAAELSALKVEKEKEWEFLKKENRGLRIQLRDTGEAVHAAGELLVRLREAEEAASIAEANYQNERQEVEKLKKLVEKMKGKHVMQIATMKNYLAETRLPDSALKPVYEKTNRTESGKIEYADDQEWRSAFGTSYRQQEY